MKRNISLKIFILAAVLFFLAGYGVNYFVIGGPKVPDRKILYYVDPMNPAYRSDKPGFSPACGMPLEPVYADGEGTAGLTKANLKTMPPGTLHITPEKQQIIGVKTAVVEKAPWKHIQRVLGKVIPDEMRIYRINAAISGSIQEVLPVTTGSLVKKNELLATFYSPEYRQTLIAYLGLLKPASPSSSPGQVGNQTTSRGIADAKELRKKEIETKRVTGISSAEYYKKILLNYGMPPHQLEEMERTGTIPENLDIRAPISGFVLARNVSPGLFFDRGAEFYRIVDLSQVWITADVFENEAALFRPGMKVNAELPYRKKNFSAQISQILPQFDPATRTLKIRLTADNPDYILRPDMLVNLEFSISGPPSLIVPADAVFDSGLKKTVFIDRGKGFFEPREVSTGRSLGERIEIIGGIMPGEKIVIAGNFLLDSEARLQLAGGEKTGKISRDPVCGMVLDEDRSRESGNSRVFQGKTYFFCSQECRDKFVRNAQRYSISAPADDQKKISFADSKEGNAKQKPHGTHIMAESTDKGNQQKPTKGPVMPKSSDSEMIPKPISPVDNQGMRPDGKSPSPPAIPPVQKPLIPPPEIIPTSRSGGSGGPPLPVMNPSQKTEPNSMPLPKIPPQPRGGDPIPMGVPPQTKPSESIPPKMITPPETKSGETSLTKPGSVQQFQGRRSLLKSTLPDSKIGGKPPSLSNIPPESKNGGKPAQ